VTLAQFELQTVFGKTQSAWRSLLSLRDPAGTSHAAGPPELFFADCD